MKEETVKQIINEIRTTDDYSFRSAVDFHKAYNPGEIEEALAEYARMRDIEVDMLEDSFIGTCILSYEMRTGDSIDKDGFIEELVVLHLTSMALDIDMYEYDMDDVLVELGLI